MALKALKRTGTFGRTTSINSNRECCVVLASIQTRTIGIVIFGQRLLVLPALNPLCFTAFTITVSLMPSFKQPFLGIWDFWGIWSMSPALLALQLLYSIAFSFKVPLKQWKEEVVLIFIYTSNAVQFLSFAEDLCIVDSWHMLQKKMFSAFVSLSSRLVSYLTSDVRNTIFWYCQHKLVKFNHSVSEVLCGCYGVFFVWKPITWWVHLHYQKTVFSTYCFFVLFLFVRMQEFTFRAQLHDFCFLWSWF